MQKRTRAAVNANVNPKSFEDSLPDVASRSFRRWGEVERTTTKTKTMSSGERPTLTPQPDPVAINRSAALQEKIVKLRSVVPMFFRIES